VPLREGKLAISRANAGCKMFESYSHMQTYTRAIISFVPRASGESICIREVATRLPGRDNESIEIAQDNDFLDADKLFCNCQNSQN
jgi:hypothetical protein